jgi:hypothetical protein
MKKKNLPALALKSGGTVCSVSLARLLYISALLRNAFRSPLTLQLLNKSLFVERMATP